MKKLLIFLCLIVFSNSSYALDFSSIKEQAINSAFPKGTIINDVLNSGNTKQIKAEKELTEKLITPECRLSMHYELMRQDKLLYEDDQSKDLTIYAQLMSFVKSKTHTTWDYPYIIRTKKLFDEIAETDTENVPTPIEFEKKKIIIQDKDFDKLNKDLKEIIYILNCY